jgi:hypothetical protein
MEPELIVGADCSAGAPLGLIGARAAGTVMAESRWPVVMTAVLLSRPGMPLLPVLFVFIVCWHGRPARRCRDVRRGLSAFFRRA